MSMTENILKAIADDKVLTERFRKNLKKCLGNTKGEEVVAYLERKFNTHLPAFQGSIGKYDPLDAMRRDAYREVFLFIRRELSLALVNEDEEETNDQ